MEILFSWIVGGGIALGKDGDDGGRKVVHILDESDRLLAPNVERGHCARKEDGIANRKNGKLVSELNGFVFLTSRALLLIGHVFSYLSR